MQCAQAVVSLGFIRGFVREAIGVIAWLGGLWLAWRYAHMVEPLLAGRVGDPPVSTWAARTLIVLAVLIVGWIVAGLLSYMLRHSGLSIMLDRLLGLVTGSGMSVLDKQAHGSALSKAGV